MARLARVVVPRLPHHVIQRGVRSMPIFTTLDGQGYQLVWSAHLCYHTIRCACANRGVWAIKLKIREE